MTDLEFAILDSLYFIESFDTIVQETGYTPQVVADELKNLIAKRWVAVYEYDEQKQDYHNTLQYDSDHMELSYYLATKNGLLAHSGQE